MFISVWLISLSVIIARSISLVADSSISFFLWLSSISVCVCVCVCVHCIFFIHSSVDGHLDLFPVLIIVNSASVSIGCMYLFELECCLHICPGAGFLGHITTLFLVFEEAPHCFHRGCTSVHSHQQQEDSLRKALSSSNRPRWSRFPAFAKSPSIHEHVLCASAALHTSHRNTSHSTTEAGKSTGLLTPFRNF